MKWVRKLIPEVRWCIVNFKEERVGGRARVTTDEDRVLRGVWWSSLLNDLFEAQLTNCCHLISLSVDVQQSLTDWNWVDCQAFMLTFYNTFHNWTDVHFLFSVILKKSYVVDVLYWVSEYVKLVSQHNMKIFFLVFDAVLVGWQKGNLHCETPCSSDSQKLIGRTCQTWSN